MIVLNQLQRIFELFWRVSVNSLENIKSLSEYLEDLLPHLEKQHVVLLDADRTICQEDTSRRFNIEAGIDLGRIKSGFKRFGYTFEGFFQNAAIYSELDVETYNSIGERIAREIELYPGVLEFIHRVSPIADVCIVTAGVRSIWENILINNDLGQVTLIAGNHMEIDRFIVGRDEKGLIATFLRSSGIVVTAFGDTDVDTLMLQNAHHAIIVMNHKRNWDLVPHLHGHQSLCQISFTGEYHHDIPITSYETVMNDEINIK